MARKGAQNTISFVQTIDRKLCLKILENLSRKRARHIECIQGTQF